MKIRPVGAEFHADERTDRHNEAKCLFSQFFERALKGKAAPCTDPDSPWGFKVEASKLHDIRHV